MRPVLLQIENITLLSYTVFLDLAVLAGLWTAYRLARRSRLPAEPVLDAALWGIVAGMVGARAHFATTPSGPPRSSSSGGAAWPSEAASSRAWPHVGRSPGRAA